MQIAKDTIVTLDYRVSDSDGNLIDEGATPLTYLHGGYGGIFDKIEQMLQGKTTGAALDVRLEPEDAFGDYDAERVMVEPRGLFPENIEIGMQFERAADDADEDDDGDDGDELFTITDIADDTVVIDGNHPLAGLTLIFACTVTEVRAATAEELAHGHVHGPDGGHTHH